MSGTLYVVSTPIGNLADVGARAKAVLASVAAVVCEDTRVTRKLLSALDVDTPMVSCHAHSPPEQVDRLVARLATGEDLAIVSDAGTPLVSDPGAELVSRAIERSVAVVPIPGPSAVLAALVGSGLPAQPFAFLGFLPRGRAAQTEALAPYAPLSLTLVVYEAPNRVPATLGHLADVLGPDRRACVARELTKRFETFERGTLRALADRLTGGLKGEVVIVVGPPELERDAAAPISDARLEIEARRLLEVGRPPSEAARTLAGALGVPKKRAYQAVLRVCGPAEDVE